MCLKIMLNGDHGYDVYIGSDEQLMLDYLWHLQSILRSLSGEDRVLGMRRVLAMKDRTPKLRQKELTLNLKYKIWYRAFVCAPKLTARLRNLLKIGC